MPWPVQLPTALHGWDPWRILAQICVLQCVHYILLATFVPPLLSIFTESAALRFEGGPAQVGMMLDWREVASKPTWDWTHLMDLVGWKPSDEAPAMPWTPTEQAALSDWTAGSIWLQGSNASGPVEPTVVAPSRFRWNDTSPTLTNDVPPSTTDSVEQQLEAWEYRRTHDKRRGWAISAAWMLTVFFDVQVLYYLVRKPTHVLDFVSTMHFTHLLITTWVAGAVPYALYWWALMIVHASLCIILAERFAIQREMRMGFTDHAVLDDMEMHRR